MDDFTVTKIECEIVKQLSKLRDYSLSGLKNIIPDSVGGYDFYFPLKDIDCSNILLASGVSEEFIGAVHNLIKSNTVTMVPVHPVLLWADGGDNYDLEIVDFNKFPKKGSKSLVWAPLLLRINN